MLEKHNEKELKKWYMGSEVLREWRGVSEHGRGLKVNLSLVDLAVNNVRSNVVDQTSLM